MLANKIKMLKQFRTRYPHGSLISDLIEIDRGQYIVKVTLQINEVILATGLAAADKVEIAEDKARERALLALALDSIPHIADEPQKVEQNIDRARDESSKAIDLPFKPEATTKTETNLVTSSVAATISDAGNNNQPKFSNSPSSVASTPEIKPTNINSAPVDVTIAPDSLPEMPDLQPTATSYDDLTVTAESDRESVDNSPPEIIEFDFNEIKNKTDVEIKRLGWTKEQGRDFLLTTYGKRSRLHLTDEELMDFLHYLESQ